MTLDIVGAWQRDPLPVLCRFLFVFGMLMLIAGAMALAGGVQPWLKLAVGFYAWVLVFVLALCRMAAD